MCDTKRKNDRKGERECVCVIERSVCVCVIERSVYVIEREGERERERETIYAFSAALISALTSSFEVK